MYNMDEKGTYIGLMEEKGHSFVHTLNVAGKIYTQH
jgi:hypothetical protein